MVAGLSYYEEGDFEKAECFVRRTAEQGESEGQFTFGVMYVHGHGVEQDIEKAVYWFRKAAEQDYSKSQHNLGVIYKHGGKGVSPDLAEAKKWYRLAAQGGNEEAKRALSRLE
jgi:TPR repeat protein